MRTVPVPAVARTVAQALHGTAFEGRVHMVGGAVRDLLLGMPAPKDVDLVVEGDATALAQTLWERGVAEHPPTLYANFGTAQVKVEGVVVEAVTARKESYRGDSRKPTVEPASLLEDAQRRDFTVNALLLDPETGEVTDPLGQGLADLESRTLRTPLGPAETFSQDPLRMLRAVRFRWQVGLTPAPGLVEAVRESAPRLAIISVERIAAELGTMLGRTTASDALRDLMDWGLLDQFWPEFGATRGVDQGSYHHLDVWEHTLLVVRSAQIDDLVTNLGCLFHDVGKPATRSVEPGGKVRFFDHENVGAETAREMLQRLRFPGETVTRVCRLVKNHMRLGSAAVFTPSAARRVVRDLGEDVGRLLDLVDADVRSLRPGVDVHLNLGKVRQTVAMVQQATPADRLVSPLDGREIMAVAGVGPGPEVAHLKRRLTEEVLEGRIQTGDKAAARAFLRSIKSN
ncbi:MAG: HDIG domain-containing protein [Fimbriimonadaceae bacterium]|nr:HDIG domain-containing protein [Fimbriimonadaceae bacterium]